MRALTALSALALLAAPAFADQHKADKTLDGVLYEVNTIRFGSAYMTVFEGDAGSCAASCNNDAKCAVWVYRPVTTERVSTCELKSMIGQASTRPGAISGLSGRVTPAALKAPDLAGGPDAEEEDLFLPTAAPTLKPVLTTQPVPQSDATNPVFTIDPVPSPFEELGTPTPAGPEQVIVAPNQPVINDKEEAPLIIFKDETDAR